MTAFGKIIGKYRIASKILDPWIPNHFSTPPLPFFRTLYPCSSCSQFKVNNILKLIQLLLCVLINCSPSTYTALSWETGGILVERIYKGLPQILSDLHIILTFLETCTAVRIFSLTAWFSTISSAKKVHYFRNNSDQRK